MIDERYLRRRPVKIFSTITNQTQTWEGTTLADYDSGHNSYEYKCEDAEIGLWVKEGEIYVAINNATPLDCISVEIPPRAVDVKVTESKIAFSVSITYPNARKCEECSFYEKCCIKNCRLQKGYISNDKYYFDFEIIFGEEAEVAAENVLEALKARIAELETELANAMDALGKQEEKTRIWKGKYERLFDGLKKK